MSRSDRVFYVYEHREVDTGRVFYIGKGKGRRAFQRQSRNRYWRHIVRKHGFVAHIIFDNLSEQDALRLETALTYAYGMDQLAVLTAGGAGTAGFQHSPETKARMSATRRGRIHSSEAKARMSLAVKSSAVEMERRTEKWRSDNNPSKCQVNRTKSSERMVDNNPMFSAETVEKMRRAKLGRTLSDEHKALISEALRGEKHPLFGKERSTETCSKMREGNRWRMKSVRTLCGLTFESTKAAAIATGARQGNIVNCCRGRTKSAGGYQWQYVTA